MGEANAVVVVGADGSPDAQKAVDWAATYAAATGATLRLVTVWAWPISFGFEMHVDAWKPEATANEVADKTKAGLSLPDGQVEVWVRKGAAPDVLVDAGKDASLLVVGRQGYGHVSRALLGSVSTYCLQHATCPVAVVP